MDSLTCPKHVSTIMQEAHLILATEPGAPMEVEAYSWLDYGILPQNALVVSTTCLKFSGFSTPEALSLPPGLTNVLNRALAFAMGASHDIMLFSQSSQAGQVLLQEILMRVRSSLGRQGI